ncbi:MAG: glutamyl-tRNA reductase [Candidatus Nitrosopolaris sp.]|jgi:glutamyl-tRNA reductase
MRTSTLSQPLQVINARITYRNAPIHLLERFAFVDSNAAHRKLIETAELGECIIIQTCNRVEIFAASKNPDPRRLLEGWAVAAGLSYNEVADNVEICTGKDVILHLLKLSSGLDSLVIGEDQVLGQVKRSFEFSRSNGYTGSLLSVIFDRAIKIGGKVRTMTGLNKGSVSIGSMAVKLAEEHFDKLSNRRVLLIGSGEGASLVAKSLKQRQSNFMITSRTFERAKSFAERVGGNPVPFDSAVQMFQEVDLIFMSTTAPYYLITYDRIEKAMANRDKWLLVFDLSNPRTVEDKISTIKNVKLFNIDQISEKVERNIRLRKNEIESAERIIDAEMKMVDTILKRKEAEPIVVSIFKDVDGIRERELKKAISMLGHKIGPEERRILEQFSYAMVEAIMSTPMNRLRKEIETESKKEDVMRIAARLFNYHEDR